MQFNFLDSIPSDAGRPDDFPRVRSAGVERVAIDTETTGIDPWRGDRAVGYAVGLPGDARYLPFAHAGGGNHPREAVMRWARDELRGVKVAMLNAKFDDRMMRADGIDLAAAGCTFEEVGFAAALLDSNQKKFTLDALSETYLEERKMDMPVAPERLYMVHASQAAPYARRDAELTLRLAERMIPEIRKEVGLSRVYDMEIELLPIVSMMEDRGCPFDSELFEEFRAGARARVHELQCRVNSAAGFDCSVNSPRDMARLFRKLCPDTTLEVTPTGLPSTRPVFLRSVGHPVMSAIADMREVKSLQSKFLDSYGKHVTGGVIRYHLHQLRGDFAVGTGGAVTGRFSSSNINVQQVPKPVKQSESTREWVMRRLFVPPPGRVMLAADASQIEFRVFAALSRDKALIREYVTGDPDFHQFVSDLTKLPRFTAKNVTFCRLFGGGVQKISDMAGMTMNEAYAAAGTYDRKFPMIRWLDRRVRNYVRETGYTTTIMGRRRHYPKGPNHSCMNAAIQGTAADLLKMQMLRIPALEEEFGVVARMTVHDEIVFDAPADIYVAAFRERLNETLDPRIEVPIKWDVEVGASWADC